MTSLQAETTGFDKKGPQNKVIKNLMFTMAMIWDGVTTNGGKVEHNRLRKAWSDKEGGGL